MRLRQLTVLLVLAGAAAGSLATAACAGPLSGAPGGPSGDRTSSAAPAGGAGPAGEPAPGVQNDWQHTLQVVANLRAAPPSRPVVYLLGGSVARECIVSEAGWQGALSAQAGYPVLAYDLANGDRTTAQDVKIVGLLPDAPSLVLISVNVGRFTRAPSTPALGSADLPAPATPLPDWRQHVYSTPLSVPAKRALVTKWMQRRYPLFKKYYAYNLGMLERLVKACKARHLHPVFLDLPRNQAIIGAALAAPVTRYHRGVTALADKYRIPYVNFVKAAGLANSDFYDLWHLIEPGRAKWQPLLAKRAASLLAKYHIAASPSPAPTP